MMRAVSRHELIHQLAISRTDSRFPKMPTIRLIGFYTINSIKGADYSTYWVSILLIVLRVPTIRLIGFPYY